MSSTMQQPPFVYCRGAVRPREEAVIHVETEAVVRGVNVFEGLKGYWLPDGSFGILTLEEHFARLRRSAALLHIPFDLGLDDFADACFDLVAKLHERPKNMWIRATLYVTEGFWHEDNASDLVLLAYHSTQEPTEPIRTGVSTWQRAGDAMLPYRIKTGTNYQVARLAKFEGASRGYPEMMLMNQHGRIAESTRSAVLMVRNGRVITPPHSEGAFESITVNLVEALCRDMGIGFERRPIDRTEMLIADELAYCGTLAEIMPISEVDGFEKPDRPILGAVAERFLAAATGADPHPAFTHVRRELA